MSLLDSLKSLIGSVTTPDTELRIDTSTGDHDTFAHYADKGEITYALIYGVEIVSLCGKKWIPSKDPSRFPVCSACKHVLDLMNNNEDEDPDEYSF